MAYKIKDGKGPYPNKAGEFCGNYHPDPGFGIPQLTTETIQEATQHHVKWLLQMRFGKPSNCPGGTSEEMTRQGFVGLYLKKDRELYDWEMPIETDKLTEAYVTTKSIES